MEMNRTLWDKLWEVVNLSEDYFVSGYKTEHKGNPVINFKKVPQKAVQPSRTELPPQTEETTDLPDENFEGIAEVGRSVVTCTECGLSASRTKAVPGNGSYSPKLLVVGGIPGEEDDKTGFAFAGAPGDYLDKWLSAIKLDRGSGCYLTTLVKCRPAGDLEPFSEEVHTCLPYLERQIELLKPKVILTLGILAGQFLTGEIDKPVKLLRRGSYAYCSSIPIVPTYHPEMVLADSSYRADVWADLKKVKTLLDSQ